MQKVKKRNKSMKRLRSAREFTHLHQVHKNLFLKQQNVQTAEILIE